MANYFIDNNGGISTNKRNKGKNYIIDSDGKISLMSDSYNNNEKSAKENLIQKRNTYQKAIDESIQNNNEQLKKELNARGYNSLNPLASFKPDERLSADSLKKDRKNLDVQKDTASIFKAVRENTKDTSQQVNQALNDLKLAQYQYNQEKVNNEKTTFWDKTGGNVTRALADMGSMFTAGSNIYTDENGNEIHLPTYNQLKQDKVRKDYDTGIGRFLGDVTYNSSKILASTGMNALAPGSGTVLYWTDMFTDNVESAKSQGYSGERSLLYSTISTGMEYLTGKFLGSATKGLTGGTSSGLEEALNKGFNKLIGNKTVANILANAGSEGTEEFIQEYLENLNKLIVLEGKNPLSATGQVFNDTDILSDALYSAAVGAVSGGALSFVNGNSQNKNVFTIFREKLKKTKANTTDQAKIDVINKMIQEIDNGEKITVQDLVEDEQIDSNNKNVNLPIREDLGNIKGNPNSNLTTKYSYVRSNNSKIDNLRKSASNYLSNNVQSQNLVNTFEKIIADKNYNVLFDDTIINKNGDSVNAQIKPLSNGEIEIRINPNSPKAGEFLIVHEITHSIETKEMKKLVLEYASRHQDFQQALDDLKTTYGTNDVSSEVLADISGQLFGNQEFINNLSSKQPNIFKRIYNSIISLANKITGNSNEALFIRDLKNKWETAYRDTTQKQAVNNVNNVKFSEIYNDDGTINRIKINEDIFKNNKNKSVNKTIEDYLKQHIGDVYTIIESGQKVYLGEDLPGEYAYSKSSKSLPLSKKMAKGRAIANLQEIVENASNRNWKKNNKSKHDIDAKYGFYRYDTTFSFDYNNQERIYNGTILIRNDANGKKYLYDILNIKQQKKLINLPSVASNSNKSSAIIDGSSNQSNSNITQSKENVKLPTKYSMQNSQNDTSLKQHTGKWQEYLDRHYKPSGTRTNVSEIRIPTAKDVNKINMPSIENEQTTNKKILNPNEISQISKSDADTTPILPTINRNRIGDGDSKFASNIENKVNMLNEKQKQTILDSDEIKYYDKVTNKESLDKAFEKINNGGLAETLSWQNRFTPDENGKMKQNPTATDVAEGWILMKQYSDNGDYDSMVEIAKTMRRIGSIAGQTVQAFNIMERMTPEGMVKYAQSELQEAWEKMRVNKTQEWVDKYKKDFDLTPDEVQFIMDNMKEVSKMEDGYDKRVKLAEIQKLMTDKLPPEKGKAIKSWMRISMLFNPKTQVRNVVGNAIIMPVNSFGDLFSSYADKIIAKKTGVRTTGRTNIKAILKGMKEGAYQATNDYRKGINTKDMQGNRFEIGEGKSFNEKTVIGKSLNRVDGMLNYVMDAGDRIFSQAAFENSLRNQMVLNNTTEVTQDMIDIARTESLQRTWNDNNNYTRFVLNARKGINKFLGTESYGLGDVLIPFAKTPANLTKAIVDYSPAGLVKTIIEGVNLKRSIETGQYTAQMQHKFVQDLGKATAGSMLYVLGYALAKAGIASGKSDDDKDIANFLKNTLGISSYSIKIGNKSFTYDWAQPIAAPLSIMTNIVNSKNNKGQALTEAIVSSLDSAGSILLEQSFLQSLNDVLNDNDGVVSGMINEMLELPSRAIPTFSKQIADMVDGTQRTTFEYGKPLESAINSAKAKIPFVSKTLAPTKDTLGRDIKKYGGKNNIFNVFLNPANVNTENISKSAKEIYRLYKKTGDATIMPRVAPYYVNQDGEKITLSSKERSEYQKISGEIIESSVSDLLDSDKYKQLSDIDKSSIINDIVNYSYNKAREDILNVPMSNQYNKINMYTDDGGSVSNYYLNKEEVDYSYNHPEKYAMITQITTYDKYKTYAKELENIRDKAKDKKSTTITYINSLPLSIIQKAMFIRSYYSSFTNYDEQIINYINSQKLSVQDKEVILKKLGFTIKNGRVYS